MQRQGRRPGFKFHSSWSLNSDEIEVNGFLDKTEHGNHVRVLEAVQDADLGIEVSSPLCLG
jgi:hypothetical protein